MRGALTNRPTILQSPRCTVTIICRAHSVQSDRDPTMALEVHFRWTLNGNFRSLSKAGISILEAIDSVSTHECRLCERAPNISRKYSATSVYTLHACHNLLVKTFLWLDG